MWMKHEKNDSIDKQADRQYISIGMVVIRMDIMIAVSADIYNEMNDYKLRVR